MTSKDMSHRMFRNCKEASTRHIWSLMLVLVTTHTAENRVKPKLKDDICYIGHKPPPPCYHVRPEPN